MVKQAVFGILFNEDRTKVLLIKRRDIPTWVIPGGGIDPGESPIDTVLREMKEETGFRVGVVRKVAEYSPVNWMTQFSHIFECKILDGSPSLGKETKQIAFFPIGRLPPLPPPYPAWIREAHANLSSLIQKPIEGVTYLAFFKLLILHPILVMRFVLTKFGIRWNSK